MFINVRGINSKINNNILQDLCKNYDIVGFAETFSNSFDKTVFSDFNVYTGGNEHKLKAFHGLALMVKTTLQYIFSETSVGLWCKIKCKSERFNIGLFYAPCEVLDIGLTTSSIESNLVYQKNKHATKM